MASIQELVDGGKIRVSNAIFVATPDLPSEAIAALQVSDHGYAGAVVLAPSDSLPPEVGPRCWANRLYTAAVPHSYSHQPGEKLLNSPPPLWLVVWTTDEIEAGFSAVARQQGVMDLPNFHAARAKPATFFNGRAE